MNNIYEEFRLIGKTITPDVFEESGEIARGILQVDRRLYFAERILLQSTICFQHISDFTRRPFGDIIIRFVKSQIKAQAKKLRATWSVEPIENVEIYQSKEAEQDLLNFLNEE